MARILTIMDDDGNEVKLPTHWVICSACRGEGKSSLYLGAITMSDRERGGTWEDPDDFEEYIRGGYDRECDKCEGTGKVRVVDRPKLTAEQEREYEAAVKEEREYQAAVAAERRMGC